VANAIAGLPQVVGKKVSENAHARVAISTRVQTAFPPIARSGRVELVDFRAGAGVARALPTGSPLAEQVLAEARTWSAPITSASG